MPAADSGFKIISRHATEELTVLADFSLTNLTPIVSEAQTTERIADRAFRGRRGRERVVVYFEAYTYWRPEARWNLLAKSGLLSERERLPTVCLVFILRPNRYRPQQGQISLNVAGELNQYLRVREVCLWTQTPERWWQDSPGLMALYPLSRHGLKPDEAVSLAAGAIRERSTDSIVRSDLLTTLAIFGKLAYEDLDVLSLIGRDQMKESPLYQEIKNEGRQEGLLEGHLEGRLEGELLASKEFVLDTLKTRFGDQAMKRYVTTIGRIHDRAHLAKLHRLAIKCTSLSDFNRGLKSYL